ncbi:MAG TPA: secondary thiamine-phosphate synthase enzyme YjbQ [Devosiaceae bacterium]|jgi:secondary thiamine-phosphate synthase enzyme|nr:secondary thiamine-phosphate synthase enzyme YjbQ [Devosiaceae bacterium]
MRQLQHRIEITTHGAGLYELSETVREMLAASGLSEGVLTVFCRHTSCSLLLQENADPDVRADLQEFFGRLVPEGMDWITHRAEGPDDMPAHIKAALTQTSLSVPFSKGKPLLGTWQGLYLFEHRSRPHRREVVLHAVGE